MSLRCIHNDCWNTVKCLCHPLNNQMCCGRLDFAFLAIFANPKYAATHLIKLPWWKVPNSVTHVMWQKNDFTTSKMMIHPKGLVINIVIFKISDCSNSCKEHEICVSVVSNDILLHLANRLFFLWCLLCILQSMLISSSWLFLFSLLSVLIFCSHAIHTIFCCGMDGFDRYWVGFAFLHLIKHANKYNSVLLQVTYIYSVTDDSIYRRHNVNKNHGFAKAVLILVNIIKPIVGSTHHCNSINRSINIKKKCRLWKNVENKIMSFI